LAALQKTVDSRFDRVLSEAQKKQIKSVLAPFGPPQGNPGRGNVGGQPGKIFSPAQQDVLKLSPEQRKRIEEIQKEIDTTVETLLTEDQKEQLQSMRQVPTGGGGPAGPARPGGPPAGGTPLFRAYRYAIDFPGFAGKSLTPGELLAELPAKEAEKKASESKK